MKNFFKTLYKARKSLYSLLVLTVMQSYMLIPSMYALESGLKEVFAAVGDINISTHQGQKSDGSYVPGNLVQYSEGDYINFRFSVDAKKGTSSGKLAVDFSGLNNKCLFFTDFFSLESVESSPGTVTPTVVPDGLPTLMGAGTSSGVWRQVLDISYPDNFSSNSGVSTVYYKLKLSYDAADCVGSSTSSSLDTVSGDLKQTGNMTVSVPAKDIIRLPSLTVVKSISTGTASPSDWCFNVSPSINGKSVYCIATDGNNVDRVVIENIPSPQNVATNYTITEVNLPGYSFVSGAGTNCSFSGSTATATVTSASTAVNASCTFTNGVNPSGLTIYKDVQGPNGEDVQDTSSNFTVTVNNADPREITDNGSESYSPLSSGTYLVKETVPSGYVAYELRDFVTNELLGTDLTNGVNVTVGEAETRQVLLVNRQLKGTLKVYKDVVSPTGEDVEDDTEFTVNITGAETHNDKKVSEESSLELQLRPGSYAIDELLGHYTHGAGTQCNDYEFEITPGGMTELTCINQQTNSTVVFHKEVVKDGEVEGTYDYSATDEQEFKFSLTGISEKAVVADKSGGKVTDSLSVVPGLYSISEGDYPDFEFLGCRLGEEGELDKALSDLEFMSGQTYQIYCENRVKMGSVEVYKYLRDINGIALTELDDDTEFEINVEGPESYSNSKLVKASNSVVFKELKVGTYVVYEIGNENYKFIEYVGGSESILDGIEVVVVDRNTADVEVINQQLPGEFTLSKVLYNPDGQTENTTDETKFEFKLYSDSNKITQVGGTIELASGEEYTFEDLNPGTYYLFESSNTNYEIDENCNPYEFTVESGVTSYSLTCYNNQINGTLNVYKSVQDIFGVDDLDDDTEFRFTVGGEEYEFSQNSPKLEISLAPGVYTVEEIENANYGRYEDLGCGENGEIEILSGQESEITCVNKQKPATVTVFKEVKNSEGEWESIYSENEFTVELSWDTDSIKQGTIADKSGGLVSAVFDNLNPGVYSLTELASDGFNFDGCYVYEERESEKELSKTVELSLESGDDDVQVWCENTALETELRITKLNNSGGADLLAGSSVVYTLLVTAPESEEMELSVLDEVEDPKYLLNDVVVTDLTPEGIDYVPGTWSATKNGAPLLISEPVYNSPGNWMIGDMKEGDVVILTYLANISNSQDAGVYDDLAIVKGMDVVNETVIGDGDDGYFAGTTVSVVNDVEEGKAEVLGVTLPNTGAEAILTIFALLTSIVGFILLALGGSRKKLIKGAIAVLVVGLGIFSLMTPMQAQAADSLSVKVVQPKTPSNKESFKLSFVALDVENRPVTAKCEYRILPAGVFAQFDSEKNLGNGGNSSFCNVTSSQLTVDGEYEFRVTATAGVDNLTSLATYKLDTTGPELVRNYENEKGTCTYTLTFLTADDGQTSKVQIFRSTQKSFVANSSTLVQTISVGPNTPVEYTNTVPNCNLEYFFAVRALDSADNSSDFVADTLVTVEPGQVVDGGTQGGGGQVGGVDDQQGEEGNGSDDEGEDNGDVKGEEDEDENKDEDEDKDSESDSNKVWDWLKYVLIVVGVLVLGGLGYLYVKNRNSQGQIK